MALIKMTKALIDWCKENVPKRCPAVDPNATWETHQNTFTHVAADAIASGVLSTEKYSELVGANVMSNSPTADQIYGGGTKSNGRQFIRVKGVGESYSTTKSVALHEKSGKPVMTPSGEPCTTASQFELAKAGALMKKLAQRNGLGVELTEHDKNLVEECFLDDWCGEVGGEYQTKIAGSRVKTVLDDVISGGFDAIPVWFDKMAVTYPLLHSEILPHVDLVDVPQGSRISTFYVENPTVAWGNPEGAGFAEFNSASIIGALSSTVFPVTIAVTFGRDALEDSPAALGAIVQTNIGQSLMHDLDNQILHGDGTTQPQGITIAAATTATTKAGGAGTAWQVNDLEALMFAVAKQYRNAAYNPAYISNDTTYGRTRSIAVGPADARRVFGMNHSSYKALEWPYRIEQNIANPTLIFACLKKYRLYRRLGARFEFSKEGRALMLSNEILLTMRARYAGRVMDPAAFALCTTGQA